MAMSRLLLDVNNIRHSVHNQSYADEVDLDLENPLKTPLKNTNDRTYSNTLISFNCLSPLVGF